jgi:glutathionyl-hydroquinone reductase
MESPLSNWFWKFMAGEISKEDLEYFVIIGVLEFSHIDENGDEIYSLTDKAKDLAPEFYENQMKDLNATVFSLWNKGIIDVIFDESGDTMISLNEDTAELLKTIDLDEDEHSVIEEILVSWHLKNLE